MRGCAYLTYSSSSSQLFPNEMRRFFAQIRVRARFYEPAPPAPGRASQKRNGGRPNGYDKMN
jgi:hypothetical protein